MGSNGREQTYPKEFYACNASKKDPKDLQ